MAASRKRCTDGPPSTISRLGSGAVAQDQGGGFPANDADRRSSIVDPDLGTRNVPQIFVDSLNMKLSTSGY